MRALPVILLVIGLAAQAAEPLPREQFEALYEADSADRQRIEQLSVGSAAWQAAWKEVLPRDAERMKTLRRLLAEHGWPQRARDGGKAIAGAFLVIQHAELEDQRWGLPWLVAAQARGDADGQQLALLTDRIAVRSGGCQRYGTQLSRRSGDPVLRVEPVDDPAGLEARRANLGLPSMREYLQRFRGDVDDRIPACAEKDAR